MRGLRSVAAALWLASAGVALAQGLPAARDGGTVGAPDPAVPQAALDEPSASGEGAADPAVQAAPEPPESMPKGLPGPAATSPTLAEMRADLAGLGRSLQALRAELTASGPGGFKAAGGPAAIARMDRMEAQIARLTGAVEQARNRVDRAIAEGTARADDLEFRLCQLEPSCDLAALTGPRPGEAASDGTVPSAGDLDPAAGMPDRPNAPAAPRPPASRRAAPAAEGAAPVPAPVPDAPLVPLRGGDAAAPLPAAPDPAAEAVLARAEAALAAGRPAEAAALLDDLQRTQPAGPTGPRAALRRGEALSALGDAPGAAAAWLDAFTAAPGTPEAGQALLHLGEAMERAGQTAEACAHYAALAERAAADEMAEEAAQRAGRIGCADAAGDGEAGVGADNAGALNAAEPAAAALGSQGDPAPTAGDTARAFPAMPPRAAPADQAEPASDAPLAASAGAPALPPAGEAAPAAPNAAPTRPALSQAGDAGPAPQAPGLSPASDVPLAPPAPALPPAGDVPLAPAPAHANPPPAPPSPSLPSSPSTAAVPGDGG